MTTNEYNTFFSLLYDSGSVQIMNGDSADLISIHRNKIVVAFARVGQELARVKNEIDREFKLLTESEVSATAAVRLSEIKVNERESVSRRDLQYLREALEQGSNSCSSRLSSLKTEACNVTK